MASVDAGTDLVLGIEEFDFYGHLIGDWEPEGVKQ